MDARSAGGGSGKQGVRTGRKRSKPRRARKSKGASTLFEVSAGGVVYRSGVRGVAVCLISTKGGKRWQLPKGKRERGESLEQTAAREVAEETGLIGRVGSPLDKIDLWFTWNDNGKPVRHHKIVHFYLLEYESGSTSDHDREVHEARWFDADEALNRLSFPSERRVLTRALELIEAAQRSAQEATTSARLES